MKHLKTTLILVFMFIVLTAIPTALAASNESVQAKQSLDQAHIDISEMISKSISIIRVNETYNEALQLYAAQLSLEVQNRKANYKLVLDYTSQIEEIKKTSLKANDELKVFIDTYNEISLNTNLSEMDALYKSITNSFKEERFEDTLTLIDEGYTKMSEIESSQTALKSFASVTSRSLKSFFVDNWNYLTSEQFYQSVYFYVIIIIALIIIFWKTLIALKIKAKIANLNLQKTTLNDLIKKLQNDYFNLHLIFYFLG